MNFDFLKQTIIEALNTQKNVVNLELSSSESLLNAFKKSNVFPKAYFRSRDKQNEFLGLGMDRRVSEEELSCNNFDIPVFYNRSFDKSAKDTDWDELGESFHWRALITLHKKCNNLSIYLSQNLKHENVEAIFTELEVKEGLNQVRAIGNTPDMDKWEKDIEECLSKLGKELEKVVLARKYTEYYEEHINVQSYLESKLQTKGQHYIYLFQFSEAKTFISMSPESLFKLEKDCLKVDIIAGTRSIGDTDTETLSLGTELQNDEKEIHEHELVSNRVDEQMKILCSQHEKVFSQIILKQKYVQHLYSLYEGAIKKDINVNQIVNLLHPTPAMGGTPKEMALEIIKDKEDFTRGLYAAPCGVLSRNYKDILVGIRSVLIDGDKVNIYAGAGIVKESQSKNEWKEITKKMKNYLSLS